MNALHFRALLSTLLGALVMAALLLIPAGTLDYWQASVFIAIFAGASSALGIYLAINDPQLLARRLQVGPTAEQEPRQKIIMVLALGGFLALLVVPAFDRRFGWSPVPPVVAVAGDVLVALGFLVTFFVCKVNSYAASTIQIAEGQTVISTGPYALVRHPMYAGVLVMLVGVPLALGSWVGLGVVALLLPVLFWRLLEEEKFLAKHLPGYTDYQGKVRHRLIPYIW